MENIPVWLSDAHIKGASYLIVVLDASKNIYFPVYVMPNEDIQTKRRECENGTWTRITDFKI